MGLIRIEKFNIMGVNRKIQFLGGMVDKKTIYRRELPNRGAWTFCRFKRGLAKKRVVVFLRGS